jgi:hypothetical protein
MSGYVGPTQHQAYQNFPKLDTPFIEPNGQVNIIWYRLLITLWMKSGGSFTQQQLSQSLQSNGSGETVIIDNTTGGGGGTVVTSENTTIVVSAALASITPTDQPRPQIRPSAPVDQLHIRSHPTLMMDQLNMANITNHSLLLGHPF